MKETAEYIDTHIPPDSKILVWENPDRLKIHTRHSYQFINRSAVDPETYSEFDYAAIPTTNFLDLRVLPDEEIIYQVEKDGSVLFVLKKIGSDPN
jgi:hypothetical protein